MKFQQILARAFICMVDCSMYARKLIQQLGIPPGLPPAVNCTISDLHKVGRKHKN